KYDTSGAFGISAVFRQYQSGIERTNPTSSRSTSGQRASIWFSAVALSSFTKACPTRSTDDCRMPYSLRGNRKGAPQAIGSIFESTSPDPRTQSSNGRYPKKISSPPSPVIITFPKRFASIVSIEVTKYEGSASG